MTDEQNPRHYLVPRLRFPEFLDAGEWEKKMLGEIADSITERAADRKLTLFSITSGIGLVSQIDKFGKEIAGKQYKNYYVIKNGDFAYNKSATKEYPEGFIAMYSGADDGAVPNSVFTCFRVRNECANPKYLNYLFAKNLHGKWLKKVISVGARAHGSLNVDDKDLFSIPLPFPGKLSFIPEQQKIAECLSTLDELITAHSRKLAALKKYKQGLLQQLFPRPGETVPRLRFPAFKGAGEWEETRLNKVLVEHKLKSDGISEVHSVSVHKGVVNQKDHLGRSFAAADTSNYNLARPNDVIYTKSPTGAFPFGIVKYNQNNYNVIVSPLYGVFAPRNKYIAYILSIYFESPIRASNYLAPITQKGAKNTLQVSNDTFLSGSICLPDEAGEQQQIADCLSSLDELITAETQRIEALKAHKQGLMQQLFPVAATAQA